MTYSQKKTDLQFRFETLQAEADELGLLEEQRDLHQHEWNRLASILSQMRLIRYALKKLASGSIRFREPIYG